MAHKAWAYDPGRDVISVHDRAWGPVEYEPAVLLRLLRTMLDDAFALFRCSWWKGDRFVTRLLSAPKRWRFSTEKPVLSLPSASGVNRHTKPGANGSSAPPSGVWPRFAGCRAPDFRPPVKTGKNDIRLVSGGPR